MRPAAALRLPRSAWARGGRWRILSLWLRRLALGLFNRLEVAGLMGRRLWLGLGALLGLLRLIQRGAFPFSVRRALGLVCALGFGAVGLLAV